MKIKLPFKPTSHLTQLCIDRAVARWGDKGWMELSPKQKRDSVAYEFLAVASSQADAEARLVPTAQEIWRAIGELYDPERIKEGKES